MGIFEDRLGQAHSDAERMAAEQAGLSRLLLDTAAALLPELQKAVTALQETPEPPAGFKFHRVNRILHPGSVPTGKRLRLPRSKSKSTSTVSWSISSDRPEGVVVPGLPETIERELQTGGNLDIFAPSTGPLEIHAPDGVTVNGKPVPGAKYADLILRDGWINYLEREVGSNSRSKWHWGSLPGLYYGALLNIVDYLTSDER